MLTLSLTILNLLFDWDITSSKRSFKSTVLLAKNSNFEFLMVSDVVYILKLLIIIINELLLIYYFLKMIKFIMKLHCLIFHLVYLIFLNLNSLNCYLTLNLI